MRHLSLSSALLSAGLIVSGAAQGADLPRTPRAPAPVFVAPAPSSGFYIIGGGGVLLPGSADVTDRDCAGAASLLPCGVRTSIDADDGWSVFGAVGYRFTPWFRADLGVGTGRVSASGRRARAPVELFDPNYEAEFRTTTAFVTGYLDIAGLFAPGAFGIFEPFVGAGVGIAHAEVTDLSFSNSGFVGTRFHLPGGEETRGAWRVTAGTGIRLSPNWRVDVAYSFYDLGDLKTDPGLVLPTNGTPSFPTNGFDFEARSHAVEVGLRYDF